MEYQVSIQSPLGFLVVQSDGNTIQEVAFSDIDIPEQKSCTLLNQCTHQLEEYFSGKRLSFDLPLSPDGTPFQQKVWTELQKIPYGQTITYMDLAVRLGDPKCIRAAGTANGRNPIAIIIPCHRVIGAGNKLTGYAGGLWRKKQLLELEIQYNPSKQTLF